MKIPKFWKKINNISINRVVFIVIMLFGSTGYLLQMSGCTWPKRLGGSGRTIGNAVEVPDLSKGSDKIKESSKDIEDVSESVLKSADAIDRETENIRSNTDGEIATIIKPNLDAIDNETRELRSDSEVLKSIQEDLDETRNLLAEEQDKIDLLESAANTSVSEVEELKKQNQDLRDEAAREFKSKMAWIGVVSVFGIGASIILAFVTRSMVATVIAVGFVITLGVSIAVSLYMTQIGWITIAIAAASVVSILVYLGYSILGNNKSFDELIQTNEVAKDYLTQEARDHIYGRGAEPGIADQVQSSATKKMIRQIRRNGDKKRKFDLAPSEKQMARFPATPNGMRVNNNQDYIYDEISERPSF